MCLLQTWYGLSDYEVEDRVNDSISFSYFCGLDIDQIAPDHCTLSRFRTAMTKAGAYEFLFKEIKKQLETNGIILKKGAIVDASVNEIANLEEVLGKADLPGNIPLKADKGYQSVKNAEVLTKKKLKNHILKKAKKNKPLTQWETKFHKLVGKTRFKVGRTFGGIKRWFNGGTARYRAIEKMHT